MIKAKRMTERDQRGCLFGPHDAAKTRHLKDIALFRGAINDHGEGFGLHGDLATGNGATVSHRLFADIDHMGGTVAVKMGKVGHRQVSPLSFPRFVWS